MMTLSSGDTARAMHPLEGDYTDQDCALPQLSDVIKKCRIHLPDQHLKDTQNRIQIIQTVASDAAQLASACLGYMNP